MKVAPTQNEKKAVPSGTDVSSSSVTNPATAVSPVVSLPDKVENLATTPPLIKRISIAPKLTQPENSATINADRAKNVLAVAKSYEPVIGKIVCLFSNTNFRVFRFLAKNSLEGYKEITGRDAKEKCESIAEHVSLDKASIDLATTSLSRIAARRIQNEESMDWAAIATVGADYLAGIGTAVAELSATRREIREVLEKLKATETNDKNSRSQPSIIP